MEPDISTKIGGIELETCIFNAAGANDETLQRLEKIAESSSSAVLMKSCTLEARDGNPEPRYFGFQDNNSINSMGLPNLGYKEYVKFVSILKKKYKKPVIASISGMSLEDNITIFKAFNDTEVDVIEFNPGSPNTIGKPTIGYDFKEVDRQLSVITKICKKPLGIKLPPYFDFVQFEEIAKILLTYKLEFLATINSVGNGLVIDPEGEQVVIKPKGGFGGLGGSHIKHTALANVRKFYELIGDKIKIIGVGGVITGEDAFEFILAGASAVQVATIYMQEGPKCFNRIQAELKEYMSKKGYKNIDEFKGKLKQL